jgi:hypothetical protein
MLLANRTTRSIHETNITPTKPSTDRESLSRISGFLINKLNNPTGNIRGVSQKHFARFDE